MNLFKCDQQAQSPKDRGSYGGWRGDLGGEAAISSFYTRTDLDLQNVNLFQKHPESGLRVLN